MRYIDDIFFVSMNGEESLKLFMNHMNNYHDTIKFKFNWSTEEVDFLDVTVKLNDGIIQTDLYTKPTDKHQYLFFTSCHPSASKKGIPYGQALRTRWICSEDELFEKRANELKNYLGYNKRLVTKGIDRARKTPRANTLLQTPPQRSTRVPFVLTYHPGLPNISKILHQFQPILQSSRRCAEAIDEVPMVAYRRPRCLKDMLVRAELRAKDDIDNKGCHKCGRVNCQICNFIIEGDKFCYKTAFFH